MDHISEGLSTLGFLDLLLSFTELLRPIFVGGVQKPSLEDLIGHLDIVTDENGGRTCEYLQQYITELDAEGKLILLDMCYQAPCSNAVVQIDQSLHLFDTLKDLKCPTGQELGNDNPVYCFVGLEDYIVQK